MERIPIKQQNNYGIWSLVIEKFKKFSCTSVFLAGQLKTPVTNAHGIVEVIMLLTRERSPGSKSGGRALVQMVVQRLSVSRAFNSAKDLLGESENAWDCLGASASV